MSREQFEADKLAWWELVKDMPYFKDKEMFDDFNYPFWSTPTIGFRWKKRSDGLTNIQLYLDADNNPTEFVKQLSYDNPGPESFWYRPAEEGPAFVRWYPDGTPEALEYWGIPGQEYHPTRAATTSWYQNGQLRHFGYWDADGKSHRDPREGPAHAYYEEDGTVIHEKYSWHGLEISNPENFTKELIDSL